MCAWVSALPLHLQQRLLLSPKLTMQCSSFGSFSYLRFWVVALVCGSLAGCGPSAEADKTSPNTESTVLIAVASNFVSTLTELKAVFEASEPYQLKMAAGSTGKLYAQIVAGAPFDVFLAADQERPQRLVLEGLADNSFNYAAGKLVLWTAAQTEPDLSGPTDTPEATLVALLASSSVRRIAIANPALAPYGRAAQEALVQLGVAEAIESRLVYGENIGQAHAMVATGNADFGFTAASYLRTAETDAALIWPVSRALHTPIVQQGVWLRRAASNSAAAAFLKFIKTDKAREIIRAGGYEVAL